tara:strand:+ start:987 stop:1241 length:255 start_codon:yes stop_codon:yes gene_type:complete
MKLKVISIKYNKTRRGISYIAKTNVKGVEIINDGMGGETFLDGEWSKVKPYYNIDECELESLINDFEMVGNEFDELNMAYRMYK